MVRIIGGESKGRKLAIPKHGRIRPTSDLVKEALFNILPDQEGNCWLDLYAGTGAVALEAVSRGARCAVVVENSRSCIDIIKANVQKCGFFRQDRNPEYWGS